MIILLTLTFSCSAHNENIYKELICHQLGKEFLVSDLFVFHLGFHFISLSNPVSSQPLPNPNPVPRENNVPLFSFASLLCCCCVIKTYRWRAVHLLPSPIQSSNLWIFFSVLTSFFNKGHCDSSEFLRQQKHKLLYNLLIQNKSIWLIT